MNNSPKSSPLLKVAPLWARSSAKGGQYLSGRLAGVKVLILENRDRKTDEDPSHHLFFAEAPPRQDRTEPKSQPADWQAPLQRSPASRPPASDGADDGPPWER
jgi:hypothetical protein